MNWKWFAKFTSAAISILICFALPQTIYALEQHEKLWSSLIVQKPFSEDRQWLYLFFTSMRFINNSHPWQTGLLEAGVGRVLSPGHTLWLGYRFTAQNPNNNFHHLNTLLQQYIAEIKNDTDARILFRSRLEEVLRSNARPVSFRLRERLYLESRQLYKKMFNPLCYDEVFFQLNKTDYTSQSLVSENRLFLGFNLITSKDAFWEIGYINQYQFGTPLNNQNQMSHIISVAYLII